jgi:hypothetical protein
LRILLGGKKKTKSTPDDHPNQDNHSQYAHGATTATATLTTGATVDALEADLDTKLGLVGSILQNMLR